MEKHHDGKQYDLQERFIDFAIQIIDICESLDNSRISQYISGQLTRSGASTALLCAEALGAESRKDFVHKLKVLRKELRESFVSLRILIKKKKIPSDHPAHQECSELIAIISKSIQTAIKNMHSITPS